MRLAMSGATDRFVLCSSGGQVHATAPGHPEVGCDSLNSFELQSVDTCDNASDSAPGPAATRASAGSAEPVDAVSVDSSQAVTVSIAAKDCAVRSESTAAFALSGEPFQLGTSPNC